MDVVDNLYLVTAFIGAAIPVVHVAVDRLKKRHDERELIQSAFEYLLEHPDLKQIGAYLDTQLGAIGIDRYARSADARGRVDKTLDRLEEFLGADEPTALGEATQQGDVPIEVTRVEGLPKDIEDRVNVGDEWGALVRLRIELERAARSALAAEKIPIPEGMVFSRLLELLGRRGKLGTGAIKSALVARSVANRAAHGESLSSAELVSAVKAGAVALNAIRRSTARDR